MQTKREYAASLGLAIAGARGKFSTAAKEAIAKAEAEGMSFADTGKPISLKPATTKAEPTAPVVSKPGDSLYVSPSEFRFPESEYRAVAVIDGKRTVFGMREACNTCRLSLTNHMCASPSVLGHAVVIEKV